MLGVILSQWALLLLDHLPLAGIEEGGVKTKGSDNFLKKSAPPLYFLINDFRSLLNL